MDKTTSTHGGKRPGAGRPATGVKPPRAIRLDDDEYEHVKDFIKRMREGANMYVYKVEPTGNFYAKYEKAVQALRGYVAQRHVESDIIYDNLDGYYVTDGNIATTVDNIPQIVVELPNESHKIYELHRVHVRE